MFSIFWIALKDLIYKDMILSKKNIYCTLIILLCFSVSAHSQSIKLKKAFNGKNLKGWVIPENNIWWSAQDGVITTKNGPDKKGSILWTKKSYTDFVVELDFKFVSGTIDSGIFLRNDKQQIQLGISGSLKRDMTASPYIAGKGYPVEAKNVASLLKPKDWNTIKIYVKDGLYKTWLNGEQVMTYTSDNNIKEGPIGLQLHPNNTMEIDFKNIKIGKIK